jgi:hypothetical protein
MPAARISNVVILRINEFDPANADAYSGWEVEPFRGPIEHDWPPDTHGFEILVLESSDLPQPVPEDYRRKQFRKLLPAIIQQLRKEGDELVARFDGPMSAAGLVPILHHCTDSLGRGRFAVSQTVQLDPVAPPPISSVRLHLTMETLGDLLTDAAFSLDHDTRLRLFAVPPTSVNPLIDVDELTDDRWQYLLASAGFMISTAWQLRAVHLLTRRFDAVQTQQMLSKLELA